MEKKVKLSIETAKELYKQGGASRLFALDNYSDRELNPDVLERIKTYKDVCKELGIPERKEGDFSTEKMFRFQQIQDIQEVFNEDWKTDWKDTNQDKWYPWFEFSSGGVVRFYYSSCSNYDFNGRVAFYKNQKTSDYVGKTFIDIYKAFAMC